MLEHFGSLSQALYGPIPAPLLFLILRAIGALCFAWIAWRRLVPMLRAQADPRFDRPLERSRRVLQYWFAQWRHPRYWFAGAVHILIFAGFLILVVRVFTLFGLVFDDDFAFPGFGGAFGRFYTTLQQYAATVVLMAVAVASARRLVWKPARYREPRRNGRDGTADAVFLLALIAALMIADGLFEASEAAALRQAHGGLEPVPYSLPSVAAGALAGASVSALWNVHLGAYLAHDLLFFFLLCYRPFGIQFHVETSLFSIYFSKLDRSRLKPVRWGVPESEVDKLRSLGVKTFEDFTWKHILDFYSCADCGRCSDNCPSNAAGRALSPRFLTLKARDYVFRHFPVVGPSGNGTPIVGNLYVEDEVWSCTTCGSCEAECPLLIEYIDKVVDLRRGLVDDGKVPQSLQKPLKSIESRGNPYGKPEKKRGDWAKAAGVPVANGTGNPETLYFVDSVTSYDDRIQAIGRATAEALKGAGIAFCVLGPAEKDSGNEVRRFGEETLFLALREHNTAAIKAAGARRIVTADPHAFNALKNDYAGLPPVEHMSQAIAREIRAGHMRLNPIDSDKIYAFHDPCYLGRHNGVYDDPRFALDAIPGLKRVEMRRCRDRSFCCGGGGLALFYEPREDERIGVKRVRMAEEVGADVIVTACPFCMINIEDAIKVAGLDGRMAAIDLAELVARQMAPATQTQAFAGISTQGD